MLVITHKFPRFVLVLTLILWSSAVIAQETGLRETFLNGSEKEFGFALPEMPWLVVMETGIPGGSFTVISIYDGTTSIYFSNGGGIIGAGQHPEVAAISKSIVASIGKCQSHFSATEAAMERPGNGRTVFYFRDGDALQRAAADEAALGNGKHALSPLFYHMHELIGTVRQ